MEEINALIQEFEERNDILIAVTIYGDGSGYIKSYYDRIKQFETDEELKKFLKTSNYKK
jgi:hypothetical protein